jgi:hypothetical protein
MGMGRIKRGRRSGEGRGDGFGAGKGGSDGSTRKAVSGEGKGDGISAGKHPIFLHVARTWLWIRRYYGGE